jgi:acyl carrier protein
MSEIETPQQPPLLHQSESEINHLLRGFPESALASAQALRTTCSDDFLETCLFGLLSFYLPKGEEQSTVQNLPDALLREDLGLDSLALSEAMFKIEELFDIYIDNSELVDVLTIADARRLLTEKLAGRDE